MQVLLLALGRMGCRYREALTRHFSDNLSIVTVDPKTLTHAAEQHYSHINEVPTDLHFDLAIDARPNQDRLGVFKAFLKRQIPHLVIEKPHAASLNESDEMLALLKQQKNPPKVLMPFYERYGEHYQPHVLNQLDAGALKSVIISAGAIGLGCNGIHFIDLANHLFQADPVEIYANLHIDSVSSPRGAQFKDHSGTILVQYPNGEFILNMRADSSVGCNVTLMYEHGKIQILEQIEPLMVWYRQSQDTWTDPFYRTHRETQLSTPCTFEKDLIDHMIPKALQNLLNNHKFPNIYDGHKALRMIALAMASHLEKRSLAWQGSSSSVEHLTFQFT